MRRWVWFLQCMSVEGRGGRRLREDRQALDARRQKVTRVKTRS